MRSIEIVRLSLTPLCHPAPSGSPGDVVRLSDGVTTCFLLPDDFDVASEADLRSLLAQPGTASP